ncbi:MAG TPA: ABC transporter permease [Alphaproteobacteria bacterium]|jgi:peptide/nickel transport system permease protein|nr:ABC transporter permease [Alphaproteobacteria bacterium]
MPRLEAAAVCMLFVITLVAMAAPWLAPADPVLKIAAPFEPPSLTYLFGTDEIGRDMLARMIYGVRLTWLPSLVVIAIGVFAGTLVGVAGAVAGGLVDAILARLTELFIVIPSTMIALAAVAALGPGIWHTVVVMSVFWWPWYARIVRGEVKAVAARPHAEAARLSGVRGPRLVLRYLLPAALPTLLVTATLDVANVILVLSLFSFLGLGAPAPSPELGAMTARSLSSLTTHWWIPILPAVAIFMLVVTANLAGDGLRALMKNV